MFLHVFAVPRFLYASVNVCNCESVAWLASFLSGCLLFFHWSCRDWHLWHHILPLIFLCELFVVKSGRFPLQHSLTSFPVLFKWTGNSKSIPKLSSWPTSHELSCMQRYCCIWLRGLKLLNESPSCLYEFEHKGITLAGTNKSLGQPSVLFKLLQSCCNESFCVYQI